MAKKTPIAVILLVLVPVLLACLVTAVAGGVALWAGHSVEDAGPEPVFAEGVEPPPIGEMEMPADPRDAALARLVNEAGRAMVEAALGRPHDPRWNSEAAERDLRGTAAEVRQEVALLGPDLTVLMIVPELEATTETHALRSQAAVFPDGRVRWIEVIHRENPSVATEGLAEAAPALEGGIRRLIEALRTETCDLPTITADDLANLPPEPRDNSLQDVTHVPEACRAMRADDSAWQPKIDDLGVVVAGNGVTAVISGSWDVEGTTLVLRPLRFARLD